jgi:hypothetical protein
MGNNAAANPGELRNKPQVWSDVAALLLILVEVSWLLPWYLGVIEISYTTTSSRAFLVLGGNMLQAYIATRLVDNLRLKRNIQQIFLLMLFLLNMALATRLLLGPALPNPLLGLMRLDPGAVLVVLAGAWLWWRGISLAQGIISPVMAWQRFWFGIWMMVAYLLVVTRVTRTQPGIIPFIIFLSAGLLSLIVARIAFISLYHGSVRNPFGRKWVAIITVSVSSSILLAAFIASLLTGQYKPVLEQLTGALRWIVAGIIFLASIPGLILAYILTPLLEAVQTLIQRSATPEPGVTPEILLTPIAPLDQLAPPEPLVIPPWLVAVIFWMLVLLITATIYGRVRSLTFWKSKRSYEDPETLLGRNELWHKLRQSARQQLQEAEDRLRNLRSRRAIQAAYIRRMYGELMDLVDALEHPRPAGLTPLEYLPSIQKLLPVVHSDLELLTQAYVRVRYGELPETTSEISQLEQAWKRISVEGAKQKKLVQASHKRLVDEQPHHSV